MNVRIYQPEDYETVKGWWVAHGQHEDRVCPANALPEDGFIIDDVCCAWVYLSANAPMCRLGWPVSNPGAKPKDVCNGLESVIISLHEFARSCGCPLMEATFSAPSLQRLMKKLGFQTGDTNLVGYLKG